MTDTKLGIAIADEAGIHDAPTVVTWTEIFNLIDAAREYERKACAAVCDQMQENYKKFYRVALDDQPYDPAHCALVIRERSNVQVQRDSGSIIAGGSAGTTGYASEGDK